MFRLLLLAISLVASVSVPAQTPSLNRDLTKHWTPDLGQCPQVLWLPGAAPSFDAVRTAGQLGELLSQYPYQALVQGSWVTLRLDGEVETVELMDVLGSHQLFKNKRYLVSLLRESCRDINAAESVCEVSAVVRRLDPPEARVLRLVEYYGCFDEP